MAGLVPDIPINSSPRLPIQIEIAGTSRGDDVTFDLGKVRDRAGGGADFVEELQPVLAQRLVVDIDRDLVEEGIDVRAQLCHGAHGGGEIFLRHSARRLGLGGVDRLRPVLFPRLDCKGSDQVRRYIRARPSSLRCA